VHAKRQPPEHVAHKLNGRALRARVKHLQDAHSGASVKRGELVEPASCARDALEKLDVHLQTMARLRLFVSLPSLPVGAMFLIRGQPLQPAPGQDPTDRGASDGHLMKSLQVVGDAACPEVVRLPQIQDLADNDAGGSPRGAQGRPWSVT
jgi:hypothetical protein